jgi:hypothetical protein
MSKRVFLDDIRVARNLLAHSRLTAEARHIEPTATAAALERAAVWLTPSAVKDFKADDFQELSSTQQSALANAVEEFERVASQVPPDAPPTAQQFREAQAALETILTILDFYLPDHEEAAAIRTALGTVDFPPWVLNWDFEVDSDEFGSPTVWVTLYADERAIPPEQYGRSTLDLLPKLRLALTAAGIRRWPYIRMRTALEHKAPVAIG